jgi:hypothetical protein
MKGAELIELDCMMKELLMVIGMPQGFVKHVLIKVMGWEVVIDVMLNYMSSLELILLNKEKVWKFNITLKKIFFFVKIAEK